MPLAVAIAIILAQVPPEPKLTELQRKTREALSILHGTAEGRVAPGTSAIDTFHRFLGDPLFDASRYPERSQDRIAALEVKGQAQYLLAIHQERERNYLTALLAYRACRERHPLPSTCGNCGAATRTEALFGEGRCLEGLGRYRDAIDLYFGIVGRTLAPTDHGASARIVQLYEAAGNLQALNLELDRIDREDIGWTLLEGGRVPVDIPFELRRASAPVRTILLLAEAERQSHWTRLIVALQETYRSDSSSHEAARRLARHPKQTVPLLSRLLLAGGRDLGPVAYALGLCGTPDAVASLKEALDRGLFPGSKDALFHALDLTGDPGRSILKSYMAGDGALDQWTIERYYRKSRSLQFEGFPCPPIPKDFKITWPSRP